MEKVRFRIYQAVSVGQSQDLNPDLTEPTAVILSFQHMATVGPGEGSVKMGLKVPH